mmetsp:Transcript_20048/g.29736  ORF Transcript_20048/g.29736 Transcript_20048/m.29736 type:complete len:106 (-) Transcript_20048:2013-2330(-)
MGKADGSKDLRKRATATKKSKEEAGEVKKVYVERPKLPHVSELLIHGAPENEGKPKTFWGVALGPVLLAIVFFISFLIFINAPHELSKGHRRQTFGMNQKLPKKP